MTTSESRGPQLTTRGPITDNQGAPGPLTNNQETLNQLPGGPLTANQGAQAPKRHPGGP